MIFLLNAFKNIPTEASSILSLSTNIAVKIFVVIEEILDSFWSLLD